MQVPQGVQYAVVLALTMPNKQEKQGEMKADYAEVCVWNVWTRILTFYQ